MLIKGIKYNSIGVAPFKATEVFAPTCSMRCKGCNAKELKKSKPISSNYDSIISKCILMGDQGIVFDGLEWSESPSDLLEMCKRCSEKNLQIAIYTGHDMIEFYAEIGRYAVSCTKLNGLFDVGIIKENDPNFFAIIGKMVLDSYIPNDYYLKVGKYDKSLKYCEKIRHGVSLSTENQDFILIKAD